MKINSLFIIALFCASIFCSCTVTSRVTSYGLFERTVEEVNEALEKEGFTLVECDEGRSHNPAHAAGPIDGFNGPDYVYTNKYRFENERAETMVYRVSYRTSGDLSSMTFFVREVTTEGCETSNPKDYERLCGVGSPIHRLDNLEKDATVRR